MPDVAFIQGWGNDECLVGLHKGVACLKDDTQLQEHIRANFNNINSDIRNAETL